MHTIDFHLHEHEYDHELATGDRQAHRRLDREPNHKPKRSRDEILADIVELDDTLQTGFETTYSAARYEREWLKEALGPFYVMGDITDVLRLVKGGKEASVYLCAANPNYGAEYLAAKVFRPRRFRNLRNDALYRTGRAALEADGTEMRDRRGLHAIRRGTSAGKEMAHTSWLAHEYVTLQRLHEAGADVPEPYASGSNAILMSYIGDADMAAPTLNTLALSTSEARTLFDRIMWNIDLMLSLERVHGDLSAHNVLYWRGRGTLIDFPQVVNPYENPAASRIFARDVQRVCDYFAPYGLDHDAGALADELWSRHVPDDLWPTPHPLDLGAVESVDEGDWYQDW